MCLRSHCAGDKPLPGLDLPLIPEFFLLIRVISQDTEEGSEEGPYLGLRREWGNREEIAAVVHVQVDCT